MTDTARNLLLTVASPRLRMVVAVLIALIAAVAVANGGCSSSSSPAVSASTTTSPTVSPTASGATPTPPPQNFVSMVYAGSTPTTDPVYGVVNGYGLLAAAPTASPPSTAAPSQVITVTNSQTIAFLNFDSHVHTASLLIPMGCPGSCAFPNTFNNVNGASQASPLNTAITSAQFSTGNVGTGAAGSPRYSLMYSTGGLTGVFFFGDFYNYQSNPPMRTVIIVQ